MILIWWAALINSIAAVGAVGFAGLALMNPTALCSNAATHRYYPALVGVALVTQLFDAAIGGIYRIPGMIAGGLIAALCHGVALMTVL